VKHSLAAKNEGSFTGAIVTGYLPMVLKNFAADTLELGGNAESPPPPHL
jgi:hypothetical protein